MAIYIPQTNKHKKIICQFGVRCIAFIPNWRIFAVPFRLKERPRTSEGRITSAALPPYYIGRRHEGRVQRFLHFG